jgi:hypothetical protein
MSAHDLKLVTESVPASAPAGQGSASVEALVQGGYLLATDAAQIVATRAASCLLEPALGDRVWFVVEPGPSDQRRGYVIAVLERAASSEPARLSIDGDAELHAGQLSIRADKQLTLAADEVQVRGRLARVLLDECSMVLRSLFTHASKATFVGKLIETFADRINSHSKTSHRTIETLDQVEAGTLNYRASHSAQLGAQHTLISGTELVKVDGGQIHLG